MFRKLRIQGRMHFFEKITRKALNRVLTLESSGGGDLLQTPQKEKHGFTKQTHIRCEKENTEWRSQCQMDTKEIWKFGH